MARSITGCGILPPPYETARKCGSPSPRTRVRGARRAHELLACRQDARRTRERRGALAIGHEVRGRDLRQQRVELAAGQAIVERHERYARPRRREKPERHGEAVYVEHGE